VAPPRQMPEFSNWYDSYTINLIAHIKKSS
jgi:hypothetical protein